MAWPSIKWLTEWTDLNRKTIITALQDLEAAGFITDSGERKGATKQVKAYRLNIETVPKAERSQKRNSSEKSREQSQKRDTDTITEPVVEETNVSPTARELKPEDVVEAWNVTADRHGLPIVRKLTPERRKKLNTFVRRWSIDDIGDALAAIERSPFLLGQGPSGWRANIDFLLQPSSFTKLIEGTYGH